MEKDDPQQAARFQQAYFVNAHGIPFFLAHSTPESVGQ
jgi:hypothetical protein